MNEHFFEGTAPFMAPPSGYPVTPVPFPDDYTVGDSAYRTELRDHQEHEIMDKWCINMRHRFTVLPGPITYERLRIRPEKNKKFRKRQERMVNFLSAKKQATAVESTPATITSLDVVPTCNIIRNVADAEVQNFDIIQTPVRKPKLDILPFAASESETVNLESSRRAHPYDRALSSLKRLSGCLPPSA
eukprot:GHVR01079936.1.p2 GENE.GHVR01079936.1~~GHVR01079936.1.p2  ORF type:complete len:188 (+),score=7.44 GHVR01079936.1:681-1244(+)